MPLNDTPVPNQTLPISQPLIRTNFIDINRGFTVDHASFNLLNEGNHNQVTLPVQAVIPAPQAGKVLLYCQTSALTNQPELVFAHQAGSTAPAAARINEFTSAGWNDPGWTRLPSGILIKWGTEPLTGIHTTNVDLNAALPHFALVLSMTITPYALGPAFDHVIAVSAIAGSVFTISTMNGANGPAAFGFSYISIGY